MLVGEAGKTVDGVNYGNLEVGMFLVGCWKDSGFFLNFGERVIGVFL